MDFVNWTTDLRSALEDNDTEKGSSLLASLKVQARTDKGRKDILQQLPNVWQDIQLLSDTHRSEALSCYANLIANDESGICRQAAVANGIFSLVNNALLDLTKTRVAMVAVIVLTNFAVQHSSPEGQHELMKNIEDDMIEKKIVESLFAVATSNQAEEKLRAMCLRTCEGLFRSIPRIRDDWVQETGHPAVAEMIVNRLSKSSDKIASGFFNILKAFFMQPDPTPIPGGPTLYSVSLNQMQENKGMEIIKLVCSKLQQETNGMPSLPTTVKDELMDLVDAVAKRTPPLKQLLELKRVVAVKEATRMQEQKNSSTSQSGGMSEEEETKIMQMTHLAEEDSKARSLFLVDIPGIMEFIVSFLEHFITPRASEDSQGNPLRPAILRAVETLAVCCDYSEKVKQMMFERNWIQSVVGGVECANKAIMEEIESPNLDRKVVEGYANFRMSCLQSLTHLSLSAEHCETLVSSEGLIPALTQVLDTMGSFDYEGVRRAAIVTKNLVLEPKTREKFIDSGIGKALLKTVPSRDYSAGLVAAGALRMFLNTQEERYLVEVANDSALRLLLSLDLKTTHPHVRVEIARYLCGVLHIAGDRAITENPEMEAVKLDERPAPSTLNENCDVVAVLSIYQLLNSLPGVQFIVFLLASRDRTLHKEALAALLRCDIAILQQLHKVIHLDGTPILPVIQEMSSSESEQVADLASQVVRLSAK